MLRHKYIFRFKIHNIFHVNGIQCKSVSTNKATQNCYFCKLCSFSRNLNN
jgi:hypothetical protein